MGNGFQSADLNSIRQEINKIKLVGPPLRIRILKYLTQGNRTRKELEEHFNSYATVSIRLRLGEHMGSRLIERHKESNVYQYVITNLKLLALTKWTIDHNNATEGMSMSFPRIAGENLFLDSFFQK